MIVSIVVVSSKATWHSDILLVGLPQVLVVLLGLLLEQLEPPLQRLVLGAVLCALVDGSLCVLVETLELLDLLLEDAVFVLQGSDLLLLLEVLLLESPDLCGKLLDLGGGLVGLSPESVHALERSIVSAFASTGETCGRLSCDKPVLKQN